VIFAPFSKRSSCSADTVPDAVTSATFASNSSRVAPTAEQGLGADVEEARLGRLVAERVAQPDPAEEALGRARREVRALVVHEAHQLRSRSVHGEDRLAAHERRELELDARLPEQLDALDLRLSPHREGDRLDALDGRLRAAYLREGQRDPRAHRGASHARIVAFARHA
jgi:hypothetical protein